MSNEPVFSQLLLHSRHKGDKSAFELMHMAKQSPSPLLMSVSTIIFCASQGEWGATHTQRKNQHNNKGMKDKMRVKRERERKNERKREGREGRERGIEKDSAKLIAKRSFTPPIH